MTAILGLIVTPYVALVAFAIWPTSPVLAKVGLVIAVALCVWITVVSILDLVPRRRRGTGGTDV